ncbi:NUMOD4 domain-containing protein, partial [Terrisporobacter sp.]
MEEWKEIKGYENYFVSNFGNVKHNDKIKSQFNNRGYK